MRTALTLAIALILLPAGAAKAQHPKGFATETELARQIIDVWLEGDPKEDDEKGTAAKAAKKAIEKFGSAAVPGLEEKLQLEWHHAYVALTQNKCQDAKKHLTNVKRIEDVLGRLGTVVLRLRQLEYHVEFRKDKADPKDKGKSVFKVDDVNSQDYKKAQPGVVKKLRCALISICLAQIKPVPCECEDALMDARQAAVEALGKIYSLKGIYMMLDRPEERGYVASRQQIQEARDQAIRLRDAAQKLKGQFEPVKGAQAKDVHPNVLRPLEEEDIARLVLDTRNVRRRFDLYGRLLLLASELEPPGKEKLFKERIDLAFNDLESNLQLAASGRAEIAIFSSPSIRRDAWLKASQKAHDICEEMDRLVGERIPNWLLEAAEVQEILVAFTDTLRHDRHYKITISIADATRRIYGESK